MSTPTPRVFVIEQPEAAKNGWMPDLSSVRKYGTMYPIFVRSDRPSFSPSAALQKATKILKDFRHTDYLLWAGGDPVGLVIVSGIVARRYPSVAFLRWERDRKFSVVDTPTGFYVPLHLNFTEGANHVQ